jgi:hypothetical protein
MMGQNVLILRLSRSLSLNLLNNLFQLTLPITIGLRNRLKMGLMKAPTNTPVAGMMGQNVRILRLSSLNPYRRMRLSSFRINKIPSQTITSFLTSSAIILNGG